MFEPLGIFFLVVAVLIVAAVAFGIWLMVVIVKGIVFGVVALVRLLVRAMVAPLRPLVSGRSQGKALMCSRPGCYALNVPSARFCRRCGRELLVKNAVTHAPAWPVAADKRAAH